MPKLLTSISFEIKMRLLLLISSLNVVYFCSIFLIIFLQETFSMILFLLALTTLRKCYDGTRRSPWNEIECGDYYARAMAAFLYFEIATGQVCCSMLL